MLEVEAITGPIPDALSAPESLPLWFEQRSLGISPTITSVGGEESVAGSAVGQATYSTPTPFLNLHIVLQYFVF